MGIIDKIKDTIKAQNKAAADMADNLFIHDEKGHVTIRKMTKEQAVSLLKGGIVARCGAKLMAKTYNEVKKHHQREGRPGAVIAGVSSAIAMHYLYSLRHYGGLAFDEGGVEKRVLSAAKQMAKYDEKGKPALRNMSIRVGKNLLKNPIVALRCGKLLFDGAKNIMKHRLNLRLPASGLKREIVHGINEEKARFYARGIQLKYYGALFGYMRDRYEAAKRLRRIKKGQNTPIPMPKGGIARN